MEMGGWGKDGNRVVSGRGSSDGIFSIGVAMS